MAVSQALFVLSKLRMPRDEIYGGGDLENTQLKHRPTIDAAKILL
jgi:hypothetical protein